MSPARSALATAAAVAVALIAPSTALAERDCFWAAQADAEALNVGYPDEGAKYWLGTFAIPPGTEIVLRGRFPHARYASFNAYDPVARPTDALADVELVPDAGSVNPFAVGADRRAADRSYTVRIVPAPPPPQRADRLPNTLYLGIGGQSAVSGAILYRVYLADRDRDIAGGVGLPQASLKLPGGEELHGPDACEALNTTPPVSAAAQYAAADGPGANPPASYPAYDPLRWQVFFNLPYNQAQVFLGPTPASQLASLVPADRSGGYFSNIHNAYALALGNRSLGPVLVLEGRAPTFPRTRDGRAQMEDGQVRYWSICENERQSTRFIACLFDEDIPIDRDGRFTIVVSRPADRPANARVECSIAWLPWGPQPESLLILRHMLPRADFAQALQRVDKPGREADVVGEYLPLGKHQTTADVERRGCVAPAGPEPGAGAPGVPETPGARRVLRISRRDARTLVVTVPRGGVLRVRFEVRRPGARARLLRGRSVRAETATKVRVGVPRLPAHGRVVARATFGTQHATIVLRRR